MTIRELIKLWEAGQTSSDQEALIRDYFFHEENVPDELKPYSLIFRGFSEISQEKMSVEPVYKQRNYFKWSAIGAFATLAIVCGIYFGTEPFCYVNGRAVRNPKEALAAAENLKVLNNLSQTTESLDALEEFADYQYITNFLTSQK